MTGNLLDLTWIVVDGAAISVEAPRLITKKLKFPSLTAAQQVSFDNVQASLALVCDPIKVIEEVLTDYANFRSKLLKLVYLGSLKGITLPTLSLNTSLASSPLPAPRQTAEVPHCRTAQLFCLSRI